MSDGGTDHFAFKYAEIAETNPEEVKDKTTDLLHALDNQNPKVREAAIRSLVYVSTEDTKPLRGATDSLANRLDDVPSIRRKALIILKNLASKYPERVSEQLEAVRDRLNDEHPEVRDRAAAVVANLVDHSPEDIEDYRGLANDLEPLVDDDELSEEAKTSIELVVRELREHSQRSTDRTQSESAWDDIDFESEVGGGNIHDPEHLSRYREYREKQENTSTSESSSESQTDDIPTPPPVNQPPKEHGRGTEQTDRHPSDSDLAPIPPDAPSFPTRILVHLIFWPVYLMTVFVFQAAWRIAKIGLYSKSPRHGLSVMGGTVWLHALTSWNRLVLYLRRSWIITPGTTLWFMPGSRVPRAKPSPSPPDFPANWDEIRRSVYERDGYECQNCGAGGGPKGDAELHIDHRNPRSAGGEDHPSNLRTLCKPCHEVRHRRRFD